MIKIKTALLSVFNKEGILELANELAKHNVEILSSGGTAKYLKTNNVAVTEISEYTGFNEVFDGRVKTCLLYTSPSPRDGLLSRMPSSG